MRIAEIHHNIAELKVTSGLPLHKVLRAHKVEFEDELEDCIHKRNAMPERKVKNKVFSRREKLMH